MIDSILNFKVQYSDTDAYKVAWHGSYLCWMEAGRVDWLYLNGVDIKELDEKHGIVMPVLEIDIKYKKPAKLLDKLFVKTKAVIANDPYIVFEQTVEGDGGNVFTLATVRGLAIQNGKIMRNLNTILKKE